MYTHKNLYKHIHIQLYVKIKIEDKPIIFSLTLNLFLKYELYHYN